MSGSPLPVDKAQRLFVLEDYAALEMPSDEGGDDLALLAAEICGAPFALISLIDEPRQWFMARVGLDAPKTPREISFCQYALRSAEVFVVPDASRDARFAAYPLVCSGSQIRFCAGVSLRTAENRLLGALCVMDPIPRTLSAGKIGALQALSRQVVKLLENRRRIHELEQTERKGAEIAAARLAAIIEFSDDAIVGKDLNGIVICWNKGAEKLFGYSAEEMVGCSIKRLIPDERQGEEDIILGAIRGGKSIEHFETVRRAKNGRLIDASITVSPIKDASGAVIGVSKVARDITARKKGEAALRERDEQLRLYAEHSPVATAMVDREMRYLVVSRRWMTDFGLGETSIVGRCHYDIFPEVPQRWLEVHRRCLAGAIEKCDEDILVRADGSIHWVRWEVRPWRHADGAIGGLIIFSEDVTGRKKAEAALRESEDRLRIVTEHMTDGLVIVQLDGRVIHWNPAARAMHDLGSEADERLWLTDFASIFSLEKLDGSPLPFDQWPISRLLRGERLQEMDLRIRRVAGGWERAFRYNGAIVRDSKGEQLAFVTLTDITARRKGESRMRRLIESNVQGVVFASASGLISEANDAFLQMVGYSRDDLIAGRIDWSQLTAPESAHLNLRAGEALAEKGICQPFEKEYIRKDGSRVPVLVGIAALQDGSGDAVCFTLDLTDRKHLEQQFMRAQRMEGLGAIAGGIAHDLNNTLGPVMMAADLLQMRELDQDAHDLLDMIVSSAKRGADMVGQVLLFARGAAGKRVEVQIRHIVKEIETIVNETFLKHVQIKTRIARDLWTVVGDATQLQQVLLNLCVNARDAMPTGGTLVVSVENVFLDDHYASLNPEAKAGPHLILEIEDTGTGMPPEIVEKIFDPFFTTKETGKGTGLGLSTTLSIVKSHGGFIRVYSELGKGTKFVIYLPADSTLSESAPVSSSGALSRGNGEWIMIVDDESVVRHITQQTLQSFGYRVLVAADGAEALASYVQRRDDVKLVITDLMMPVMDGPALIQVLRKLNPGLDIIAVSGLSTNEHAMRLANLGIKHFLSKPYTADTLLHTVQKILARPVVN